jgi:hypothetical protein
MIISLLDRVSKQKKIYQIKKLHCLLLHPLPLIFNERKCKMQKKLNFSFSNKIQTFAFTTFVDKNIALMMLVRI